MLAADPEGLSNAASGCHYTETEGHLDHTIDMHNDSAPEDCLERLQESGHIEKEQ